MNILILVGLKADNKFFHIHLLKHIIMHYLIDTPPPTISGNLHIGHIFPYAPHFCLRSSVVDGFYTPCF